MRGELGSPAPNEIENGVKAARFRAFQKNNLRSKGPAGLMLTAGLRNRACKRLRRKIACQCFPAAQASMRREEDVRDGGADGACKRCEGELELVGVD
jgi:hypothetical protein